MDSIKVQPGQSTPAPIIGSRRAAANSGSPLAQAQDSVQLNPAPAGLAQAA